MAHKVYIPDYTAYEQFYSSQSGHGDYFDGYQVQAGHGVGSLLGKLFKRAIPIIRRGAKFAKPHAGKMSKNVINDLARGRSLKRTIKRRGYEALVDVGNNLLENEAYEQDGEGRRRRKRRTTRRPARRRRKTIKRRRAKSSRSSAPKRRRKRVLRRDIFG